MDLDAFCGIDSYRNGKYHTGLEGVSVKQAGHGNGGELVYDDNGRDDSIVACYLKLTDSQLFSYLEIHKIDSFIYNC